MRRAVLAAAVRVTLTITVSAGVLGCVEYLTADNVKNFGRAACVIAHAFLPEARILERCQLGIDALPGVRELQREHKAGVARELERERLTNARASACYPELYDGGSD